MQEGVVTFEEAIKEFMALTKTGDTLAGAIWKAWIEPLNARVDRLERAVDQYRFDAADKMSDGTGRTPWGKVTQ
jgi:hypothetical protein